MRSEIGSEFWEAAPIKNDKKFFLSGRTALDYIIRDILSDYSMTSVLLPSYCCDTMIEPFCKNGMNVRFYDVYFDDHVGLCVDIPEPQPHEIFYYMKYFGYQDIQGYDDEYIKKEWELVIEDRTHSWLSDTTPCLFDYSFASYRKWTGFSGIAVAEKNGTSFRVDCNQVTNEKYCQLRKRAASLKMKYMSGETVDKKEFLDLFNEAEELLEKDYVGYAPSVEAFSDFLSLDVNALKQARVRNAEALMNGLKDIPQIHLMFDELNSKDVPLFVPILVEKDRDALRKCLIEHDIYCPVHWPLSEYHKELNQRSKTVYQQELSLICDQRYTVEDMKKIISVIAEFYS